MGAMRPFSSCSYSLSFCFFFHPSGFFRFLLTTFSFSFVLSCPNSSSTCWRIRRFLPYKRDSCRRIMGAIARLFAPACLMALYFFAYPFSDRLHIAAIWSPPSSLPRPHVAHSIELIKIESVRLYGLVYFPRNYITEMDCYGPKFTNS